MFPSIVARMDQQATYLTQYTRWHHWVKAKHYWAIRVRVRISLLFFFFLFYYHSIVGSIAYLSILEDFRFIASLDSGGEGFIAHMYVFEA